MAHPSSSELAKSWPYARYQPYVDALRAAAGKWFREHGCETGGKMGYCLAQRRLWPQNIICEDVAAYVSNVQAAAIKDRNPFPLHKYVHHGLSSQAMGFNLVGPLLVRNDLAPLRNALEDIGITWPEGEIQAGFEYADRAVFNEDAGQPTSIDLAIQGSANSLFIEIKLSEKSFGCCSVFEGGDCEGRNPHPGRLDACYLHHIGRTYWQDMIDFGFGASSILQGDLCPFASYYQFFREVLLALKKGGSFVLLHDARNPAFLRHSDKGDVEGGLWPLLYDAVPQQLRNRVAHLPVQNLVAAIGKTGRHDDWIGEFRKKYGLT